MVAGATKKSDNTKYYETLGVSKNTLPADLKIAFRKAAMKKHPDRGGDPEKFKEITQAYGVLSDPLKRRIYDQYGEDALKKGGCSSRGARKWKMMGKDIAIFLPVSLEDLYNGKTWTTPFPYNVICSKCKGKGSKSGASMKCSGCRGSGTKPRPIHLGPPMIQLPFPCDECKGTREAIRETIDEEDRCEQCKGEKVLEVNKVLKFHIQKGMQNGHMMKFPKEAVGRDGHAPAFMLQQKVHPKFKRKGDDLFVEHTLSLKEALCGFQFGLTHLDKRQLIIKSQPGEVIKPGQVKEINGEGMPIYGRPYMKGKLHIHFTVEFPESLTPDQSKLIDAGLTPRPPPHHISTDMEVETATNPRGV